jgi:hypothetical protein
MIFWMRQKRDKGLHVGVLDHDAHVNDLHHQWIPRDANGDPIFFVLPPKLQEQFDERLALCEAAWREGEPLAIAEAQTWTFIYRQPVKAWLEQAVVELAMSRRTKTQAARIKAAGKRLIRYQRVRDLHEAGMTWDAAHARAGELLKCSDATAKADYAAVKRDLKAGRYGKYFNLKDKRYYDL